ncbi:MAG: M48 family metallopeptidase [Solirubrobacteraceae bacterium]|nr:M48 family metallopeptidase [Solirubrobacteraceae bacterium]
MSAEPAYALRRSDRARRVRVSVRDDGMVEVVLPRRAPERLADEAIVELAPWIARRRAEVEQTQALLAERDGTLPFLDEVLTLRPEPGRTRVHRRGDLLLVPDHDAEPAIERWYRRAARAEIEPRVAEATAAIGVESTKLTIRNQRSRWGSCSATGALSFNWRLLLAPSEILDYVVWHEACHLVHMDHSPSFWGLLAAHRPDYRQPKRWLRRHGATLVLS